MTRQVGSILASLLLSSTLAACVSSQTPSPEVAAQPSGEIAPAEQSAPDEVAFAVAPMPEAPAARPIVKRAWIKRVETRGATDRDGTVNMNAQSIQPLYQAADNTDTVFTQINIASSAQTDAPNGTSNVGLGYRKLIERDFLIGVNGFYDRDWTRAVDRTSADAELRWRTFNVAVNYYAAQDEAGEAARALDGYDLRLATQVPYLTWAQATFARSDRFTDEQTVSESYMAGIKLDLIKYLQLEARVRGDATNPEAGMVKLNFNLLPSQWGPQRRTAFGSAPVSNTILEARDLRPVTLEKVKRDNTIHISD